MSDLERGLSKFPRLATARLLADGLGLSASDRALFLAAAQGRSVAGPSKSPSNLPDEPTPLIGREREVEAVLRLFHQPTVRLVTLTGVGGTGKTRLAVRVAGSLQREHPDGVFLVSLASLTNASLVPSAIASVLGIKEDGKAPLLETLITHFAERQTLLVLDNFEHLLEAATVVESLLARCRSLRVLVTSRAPLHLRREHEFAVPALALPDLDQSLEPEALSGCDAVTLFVDRAQAVDASFALTGETAPAVASICCRLDGLPLAIELAAAQVRTLPPQSLLEHVSSPLHLLVGGAQDMPVRQRTLRSTIDWSYALLSEAEQRLFARLSVFSGGCTLEDAEAVCNYDGDLDVLAVVQALVEKNLVRRVGESELRLGLLETIREYAAERLTEGADYRRMRAAHARRYLELAEAVEQHQRALNRRDCWQRLDIEHDNFRDALSWLVTERCSEEAARLAVALAWYWLAGGYIAESRDWLGMVSQLAGVSDAVRSRALFQAATIMYHVGDLEDAAGVLDETLALTRRGDDLDAIIRLLNLLSSTRQELGDFGQAQESVDQSLALARERQSRHHIALSLHVAALLAARQGDVDRAAVLVEEALALWRDIGDYLGQANAIRLLGIILAEQEDYEQAAALLDQSLAIDRQASARAGPSMSLLWRGVVAEAQGDLDQAGKCYREAIDLEAIGEARRMTGVANMRLAGLLCRMGDYEQARTLYAQCVALMHTLGFMHPDLGDAIYGLAAYAAAIGHPADAARLLGASEVRLAALAASLAPREASEIRRIRASISEQLDTETFERAIEEGRHVPLSKLLEEVLRPQPAHLRLLGAAGRATSGSGPN